jgi:hypothetical protein
MKNTIRSVIESMNVKRMKQIAKECNIDIKNLKTKQEICDHLVKNKKHIKTGGAPPTGEVVVQGDNDILCAISQSTFDIKILNSLYEVSKNVKQFMDAKLNLNTIASRFLILENFLKNSSSINFDTDIRTYIIHICDVDTDDAFWAIDERIIDAYDDEDVTTSKNDIAPDDIIQWEQAWILLYTKYFVQRGKKELEFSLGKIRSFRKDPRFLEESTKTHFGDISAFSNDTIANINECFQFGKELDMESKVIVGI